MLPYKTYKEAKNEFDWDERWSLFDGDRDEFNIAHECIDRHDGDNIAARIKKENGESETYTYGEFSGRTSQFANALESLGVEEGERVAIMLNPSLEFYSCLFGAIKRGAIAVPGSTLLGAEGAKMRLSGDKVLISDSDIIEEIDVNIPHVLTTQEVRDLMDNESSEYQTADTSSSDIAVIQYSAGTTGIPKPVEYPQKSLTTAGVTAIFCIGLAEDDNYFNPSPPSWGFGVWYGTMAPLGLGVKIGAYDGKFNVERILEALEEFKVNNFSAVPTALRKIVNSDAKADEYSLCLGKLSYTGGALSAEGFKKVKDFFGVPPAGLYGSTEVGVILANYAGFDNWEYKPGSLGKPMPGVEVAVIDKNDNEFPVGEVGEIAVKRRDSWIRVGDLGKVDEDGFYWHEGRADDVIISSGYTVGPREVEDPLLEHPQIKEVGVIGIPDEERGQIVKAFIVTDAEPTEELKKDIMKFSKEKISKHAYPRDIEFTDELPKTESGKIRRKNLREFDDD